ncbi:MAG TPA: hypothetical protein DEO84_11320 [candidate division Zixibacteria bacterium]|nr:hypothetical protein [candidate division Zixibacteria bacterium]
MRRSFPNRLLPLFLIFPLILGCGILVKRDPIRKLNPYKNLAFYGKAIDKATKETPVYPVSISIMPEDPGNHIVVDSCIFFIEDKGLESMYDYSLRVSAQYYGVKEIPLKYIPGKAQNLGVIELDYLNPKPPEGITIKPFQEFNPGSGILEKPGWSISSFLGEWKAVDQPFSIDDVVQFVKGSLPAGSPEITKTEIKQAMDGWLKDGLIKTYGRNTYMLSK